MRALETIKISAYLSRNAQKTAFKKFKGKTKKESGSPSTGLKMFIFCVTVYSTAGELEATSPVLFLVQKRPSFTAWKALTRKRCQRISSQEVTVDSVPLEF